VKKLNVILLILSFILSGIGSIFLFDATSTTNDTIQTAAPSNKIESEEITEYTYKTYEDYFIDYFNLPSEIWTKDEETGTVTIDYTLITRKTTNGETQLSYNNDIFYTLTDKDLSGTGSSSNPYIIHSLNGFLYVMNTDFSKLAGLSSKYVEMDCDILLNDETFDENGNPSGGDGVVYQFKEVWIELFQFDGKENSIIGLYMNYADKSCQIFTRITTLKNLTLEDFYMQGMTTSGFCGNNTNLTNCQVLKGTMRASVKAYGFVQNTKYIENCVSNINIFANSGGFGFCRAAASLKNCVNYSNITSTSTNGEYGGFCGGFEGSPTKEYIAESCVNYGTIYAPNNQCAGLFPTGGNNLLIKNCSNYGKVYGKAHVGSFVGMCYNKRITILDCENYGQVIPTDKGNVNCATLIGSTYGNVYLQIKNLKSYVDDDLSLIGRMYRYNVSNTQTLIIDGCKFNATRNNSDKAILLNYTSYFNTLQVSNCKIEVSGKQQKIMLLGLFETDKTNNTQKYEMIISNIYVDGENSQATEVLVGRYKYNLDYITKHYEGIVFNFNKVKKYYGKNFSRFCFVWKTGEFGLKHYIGNGSFQSQIDEDWLINHGFIETTQ